MLLSTDEGPEASGGRPGKPGAPPQAWPASRMGMAELCVCKSRFFLDIYFHFVAVDKQHTVNSLHHGEHSCASQPASLIIPLDGFPGRELPSQRASPSVRHPIPSPSLALLLQSQDFFPTVSGVQGRWEGSSLLCTRGHGATSIPISQACPAVQKTGWGCTGATGKQGCEGVYLLQHTADLVMNE